MITEKIEGVLARIQELEHLVSPGHWGILSNCAAELTDAAEWAGNLEAHCAVTGGPKLQVVDFVRTNDEGKTGVDLKAVAGVMEDIAEALREADIDVGRPPRPSGLRLIGYDGAEANNGA